MKLPNPMRSKGQGAMEYLMNYSWAILVVVTVGLVLWQLGVFNSPTSSVTMTGWYQIQPLAAGIAYKSDGNYQVAFNNVAGVAIQITDVNVTDSLIGTECGPDVYINSILMDEVNVASVASGQEFVLTTNCTAAQEDTSYDTEITIEYKAITAEDITAHIATGRIQGTVEE